MTNSVEPAGRDRWRIRLEKELYYKSHFDALSESEWRKLLRRNGITSSNHDTVLAIDWPHYCSHATTNCGGAKGWCYTFQGYQASAAHNRRVAMTDSLARNFPELFADQAAKEVDECLHKGLIPYRNLRYSGSGELTLAHVPALRSLSARGVRLWGFTRSLRIALALRDLGAAVIISTDSTTRPGLVEDARRLDLPLAYTSRDAEDAPPDGTLVTFPVHRVGKVAEVTDSDSLCPKVIAEFFNEERPPGSCQTICFRCHLRTSEGL
jgi:hypothetical protein